MADSRTLDGKVAVVTGAGRGIGREIAVLMAKHGACVVVNDLGAGVDGEGADASPAGETVAAIEQAGGSAIANGDSVADPVGAQRIVEILGSDMSTMMKMSSLKPGGSAEI